LKACFQKLEEKKIATSADRHDRVSVPLFAVQYKKYCPQARFEMFGRSGHNLQVQEQESILNNTGVSKKVRVAILVRLE